MNFLYVAILILHIIVCFILILVILLQAGKGGGISGLFGGGDSVFGGQGPAKPLAILTAVCAGLFMVTSLTLSIMSRPTGIHSVIETTAPIQQAPTQQKPATAVPSPAQKAPTQQAPVQQVPAQPAQK